METPFVYDKYVTGKDFIGRREDCMVLANLVSQREIVTIYAPPKSGKTSVIQQALFNMRISGSQTLVGQFSVLNIRHIQDFLTRFGATAIRMVASTPGEFSDIVGRLLEGTHFVFDQKLYSERDIIISTNWDIDDGDIAAMLRLPKRLASEYGREVLMIIEEFHNILLIEDGEKLLKALESLLAENRGESGPGCSFIFCGGHVNAMKHIFEEKRFFYRMVERLELHEVSEREISEHLLKGFLSGGKVIERELLLGACKLFRNNLWYINHLFNICDSLSKGYIVESTLMDALGGLISIHEPRFISTMDSLTTFQVNMLRAILDGVTKFSASDVISGYGLNSSANVKRLREALVKKEIVTFDENDRPLIIDPLFEYWVRRYYFEME